MGKRKFLKNVSIIFVISLILEIFVFNFRFFTTMGNDEILITPEIIERQSNETPKEEDVKVSFSEGIKYEKDNRWTNDEGKLRPSFVIYDEEDAYLEIENINKKIDNVYIDISSVKRKSYSDKRIVFKLYATDEANAIYYGLPKRDVVRDVERSKYINLNLSGESEKLKIELYEGHDEDRFVFNEIKINANYPMFFSFIRLFSVFLIILAVYIVRPKSCFYKYVLNLKSVRQRVVLGLIIGAHIIGFAGISLFNPNFVSVKIEHHLQYQQLTDAILDGHVYLDQKPSKTLRNMENPYDTNLRKQTLKKEGEKFLWDRAYYNGKYYVYFGIVPVLVYYLPFKLLTGFDFPTFAGIVITAVLFMFAVLGFVHQIIKRYFKNISFIFYVLLSFFFIDSCGIMYLLKRPDFYSLPIIMALTFSVAGLYFWISSIKYKPLGKTAVENDDSNERVDNDIIDVNIGESEIITQNDDSENIEYFGENYNSENIEYFGENDEITEVGGIEKFENQITEEIENSKSNYNEEFIESEQKFDGFVLWRLVVGSLCMALVAGCRPQVLLGSFLAIPIFYKIVFKDRGLFSKTSVRETILFLFPYVVVAAGLMYYNYIRFDSVIDFGANYNLTTNDMTKRGFVLGRSPLGIFSYLFQPPAYSPRFPFISDVWFYTNYMGVTIREYLFGGILFNHFLLCINLFVLKFKNSLKLKGLFYFCIMSIIFSVCIVIADTQLAGLLQRYMVDFAWLMFIPGIILILILLERVNDYLRKHITTVLLCGFAFSFYYDFATVFFYGDDALYSTNPTIHYTVAHLVQFWL